MGGFLKKRFQSGSHRGPGLEEWIRCGHNLEVRSRPPDKCLRCISTSSDRGQPCSSVGPAGSARCIDSKRQNTARELGVYPTKFAIPLTFPDANDTESIPQSLWLICLDSRTSRIRSISSELMSPSLVAFDASTQLRFGLRASTCVGEAWPARWTVERQQEQQEERRQQQESPQAPPQPQTKATLVIVGRERERERETDRDRERERKKERKREREGE